ncbi:GNAT family N-acetyltransferase [Stenotrophomonas sp. 24(2023)]|uniref:GNAT family N-acetyltransferase n=1 Tax=Stenotrophomonas sp. 24(2023) TaxID=3068324 RepID=UPI0027E1018F|nr:GNAT family N-acetyltransferase [Stenotrophomonas sp. 24(2023)]WMJ69843.1 GNAT family N-acetyltransferase [Stenotrophomonas sp. 24(2023)]
MSALRISTDPQDLDVALIHHFLSTQAYWSPGIGRDVVERAISGSLCFGAYLETLGQVAFARVITDGATFAYLADVFVLPEHRGQGYSKQLVQAIMAHPQLQGLRRFMLATSDAHRLYAGFGFSAPARPELLMEIVHPNPYAPASAD